MQVKNLKAFKTLNKRFRAVIVTDINR